MTDTEMVIHGCEHTLGPCGICGPHGGTSSPEITITPALRGGQITEPREPRISRAEADRKSRVYLDAMRMHRRHRQICWALTQNGCSMKEIGKVIGIGISIVRSLVEDMENRIQSSIKRHEREMHRDIALRDKIAAIRKRYAVSP